MPELSDRRSVSYVHMGNRIVNLVLTLFFYLLLLNAFFLLPYEGLSWWVLLATTLAAVYVTDLISGILHIFLDYHDLSDDPRVREVYNWTGPKSSQEYLSFKRDVLGMAPIKNLSFNFKVHHRSPRRIQTYAYSSLVCFAFPLCFLMLLGAHSFVFFESHLVAYFLLNLSFFSLNIQYAHSLVHNRPHSFRFVKLGVKFLQKCRLVYSSATHSSHHRDPTHGFCLLIGWADPVVDQIFLFLLRNKMVKKSSAFLD